MTVIFRFKILPTALKSLNRNDAQGGHFEHQAVRASKVDCLSLARPKPARNMKGNVMAGSSPTAGLLVHVREVFSVAGSLCQSIQNELVSLDANNVAAVLERLRTPFESFFIGLRTVGEFEHQLADFPSVAQQIKKAKDIELDIQKFTLRPKTNTPKSLTEVSDKLSCVCESGWNAIRQAELELDSEKIDILSEDTVSPNERKRLLLVYVLGMPPEMTYEQGCQWAKDQQAKIDSADKELLGKIEQFEKEIEFQCRKRMLAAGFRSYELQGSFYPCLPRFVANSDTRFPAYRNAMQELEYQQRLMPSYLGCNPPANEEEPVETAVLLPRPEGDRPARLSPVNADHLVWIEWERSIFRCVDGENNTVKECWKQFQSFLEASAGVDGFKDFAKIYAREYEKWKRQKKLLTKKF